MLFGAVRAVWAVAVAVVVIIAILLIGTFGFGWFEKGTANFRGSVDQTNQVNGNGAYRIAAYDHFFDLCTSVQSDEASISNLQEELKTKPPQDRVTQINASITALRNERAATIAEYNNDAAKQYTEGQFKSSNLPARLDVTTEETSCTA